MGNFPLQIQNLFQALLQLVEIPKDDLPSCKKVYYFQFVRTVFVECKSNQEGLK